MVRSERSETRLQHTLTHKCSRTGGVKTPSFSVHRSERTCSERQDYMYNTKGTNNTLCVLYSCLATAYARSYVGQWLWGPGPPRTGTYMTDAVADTVSPASSGDTTSHPNRPTRPLVCEMHELHVHVILYDAPRGRGETRVRERERAGVLLESSG